MERDVIVIVDTDLLEMGVALGSGAVIGAFVAVALVAFIKAVFEVVWKACKKGLGWDG